MPDEQKDTWTRDRWTYERTELKSGRHLEGQYRPTEAERRIFCKEGITGKDKKHCDLKYRRERNSGINSVVKYCNMNVLTIFLVRLSRIHNDCVHPSLWWPGRTFIRLVFIYVSVFIWRVFCCLCSRVACLSVVFSHVGKPAEITGYVACFTFSVYR